MAQQKKKIKKLSAHMTSDLHPIIDENTKIRKKTPVKKINKKSTPSKKTSSQKKSSKKKSVVSKATVKKKIVAKKPIPKKKNPVKKIVTKKGKDKTVVVKQNFTIVDQAPIIPKKTSASSSKIFIFAIIGMVIIITGIIMTLTGKTKITKPDENTTPLTLQNKTTDTISNTNNNDDQLENSEVIAQENIKSEKQTANIQIKKQSSSKSIEYKTISMKIFKTSLAQLSTSLFKNANFWPYVYYANINHPAIKSPDTLFFRPQIKLIVDKTADLGELYYKLYIYYKDHPNSTPYKNKNYLLRRKEMIRKSYEYNKEFIFDNIDNLNKAEQKYLNSLKKKL